MGALLDGARLAGLQGLCAVGTSLQASQQAASLAQEHGPYVFASAGLHPHLARHWHRDAAAFGGLLRQQPSLAVGECGLDYFRMLSTRAEQRKAFCEQLALAQELQRPVILHEREAFEDMLSILKDMGAGLRGVVHCFTGSPAQALAYLELGLDLGVTGWLADMRRAQPLREAIAHIPLDRLHLETDAPYLLPRNMPRPLQKAAGGTNLPQYLPWVAQEASQLLGLPVEFVASRTAQNSLRLLSPLLA